MVGRVWAHWGGTLKLRPVALSWSGMWGQYKMLLKMEDTGAYLHLHGSYLVEQDRVNEQEGESLKEQSPDKVGGWGPVHTRRDSGCCSTAAGGKEAGRLQVLAPS